MMYYFNKDTFDREDRAPANARTTVISFLWMHVTDKSEKVLKDLKEGLPLLKNGILTASHNGSFHEYDWDLCYTLEVKYVTELDFDFDDEDVDDLDPAYIQSRFNTRDLDEEREKIFFLPEGEFEFFVVREHGKDWHPTDDIDMIDRRISPSSYHPALEFNLSTDFQKLVDFIETEKVRAVKAWKMSKEYYD